MQIYLASSMRQYTKNILQTSKIKEDYKYILQEAYVIGILLQIIPNVPSGYLKYVIKALLE